RLAQLGQAEFQCKVENKFLAGSSPALRITKKSCAKMAEIGRRSFPSEREKSETIKLNLFQEVEILGLNPSQTVNKYLSLLRCSSTAASVLIYLWGRSSMVERRH